MIGNDWDEILKDEYSKPYFEELLNFVNSEYDKRICYPAKENIFRALRLTPYKDVKVVILGQDPYHGENEANGLCFSVCKGVKCPPSLLNIFKELYNDLGIKRTNTELDDWAKQGILMLNTIMSVEKDTPLSHKNKGWEIFTDEIIKKIAAKDEKVIFVLWGSYARTKRELIGNHYVIESVHPSPLSASRGFFGSKPFSKINAILENENKSKIEW
ncbi:MAG: uracil-DNA glycosylase [Bacilli bacterium]|nr:uracil-DNA glycosylase [Bacilli bacterium]